MLIPCIISRSNKLINENAEMCNVTIFNENDKWDERVNKYF